MKLKKLDKRGVSGVSDLPKFFQLMLLTVIFIGLTFIVLDKFVGVSYNKLTVGDAVLNEDGHCNTTGYAMAEGAARDFVANITTMVNASSGLQINSGNWSISSTGVLLNASGEVWDSITMNYTWTYSADTQASEAVNDTTNALYDYGVGFVGILILVIMVYLIISIVSGRKSGAR